MHFEPILEIKTSELLDHQVEHHLDFQIPRRQDEIQLLSYFFRVMPWYAVVVGGISGVLLILLSSAVFYFALGYFGMFRNDL
ncbi:18816_t:CDS:2 [Rhizophagus irregularis]|nr:18816_t:CDS:2 [Rhizophagus irregularis]